METANMSKVRRNGRNALHLLHRDEHGGSLLEMGIVTPVLLAIALGIFEFGNALYQYHLITAGVRDAGRYLAGLNSRNAATRQDAKEIAVYGSLTSTDKRVEWWSTDDVSVRYCINGSEEGDLEPDCPCDGTLSLRGGANKVCVSTTVAYADLGFLEHYGLGPITITTAHEERYFKTR
jgi:hypothetical protein